MDRRRPTRVTSGLRVEYRLACARALSFHPVWRFTFPKGEALTPEVGVIEATRLINAALLIDRARASPWLGVSDKFGVKPDSLGFGICA
jgi:hypothetical protein